MLIQKDGKWVFVSRKTRRPLAYYRGEGKPSDEWVRKQEQRVQYFKHIGEEQEFVSKAGAGEWGRPELTRKYIEDTPGQKVKRFKRYIKNI
jgi:hypothetical protein